MATPVKAIYEKGFLKLLEPLDLDEGEEVEVLVFEAELGWDAQEAAEELARIAAFAEVGDEMENTSEEHDALLYGPEGVR